MGLSKKQRQALATIAGSKTGKLKKKHIARLKGFLRKDDPFHTNATLTEEEIKQLGVI